MMQLIQAAATLGVALRSTVHETVGQARTKTRCKRRDSSLPAPSSDRAACPVHSK